MSKLIGLVFLVSFFLVMASSTAVSSPALEVTSFSYDPAPASPGATLSVWIQIKNNSNENANKAFVRLELNDQQIGRPDYPFSAPEQNLEKEFSLAAYQSNLIRYSINVDASALNGDYTISISLGDKATDSARKMTQTITVSARNPKVEIIEAPKVEQRPGSQFEIPVTIKNLGNATAYNVLVGVLEDRTVTSAGTVIERPINSVGNSLQYVEKMLPGEIKVVQLHLSIDNTAQVKTYGVPVTLKWQDGNKNDFQVSRTIGVRVVKEPSIDVGLGEVKQNATNKELQDVSIDIFNKGSSTAKNVTIEIKTTDATLLSSNKVFIGTLESDDFDSFKTMIKIPTKGKDIRFQLSISYTNANEDELKVEKEITVPFVLTEPAAAENGPGIVTIIIGLIVLGVIGNWAYQNWFKKGKKE